MKVNIEIKNESAIPVSYIGKCGDNVMARALFKGQPILMEATCITATPQGQTLVHGLKNDVILQLNPDVTISFV